LRKNMRIDEEARSILKQRALNLALKKEANLVSGPTMQIVEFLLGNKKYGLDGSYIREAQTLLSVVAIPGAPDHFLGLINSRGQVIAVYDLKRLLGLPCPDLIVFNKVMIIQHPQFWLGLAVDEVLGSSIVELNRLQMPLSHAEQAQNRHVRGITSEAIVILNAETLLDDKRLSINS
jgi:purine-binding chemotaxis protein CheW